MLKAYLDITVRRNSDVNQYFVLQKVFQQLHLSLVEMQNAEGLVPLGLSFPKYQLEDKGLGNKLRLLSAEENILEKFNAKESLARFSDYVHLTGIRAVPARVRGYAIYQRQQPKSTSALRRIARRMSEREGISIQAAEANITSFKPQLLKVPYINVCSASSGQRFRLFIAKKVSATSVYKGFSSYGLSNTSTVPEF